VCGVGGEVLELLGFELLTFAEQGDVHQGKSFPPVARLGFLARVNALFQVPWAPVVFNELCDGARFERWVVVVPLVISHATTSLEGCGI